METIKLEWLLAPPQGQAQQPPAVLGTELYEDILETPVPQLAPQGKGFPVYYTKRFTGHAAHVWQVKSVEAIGDLTCTPMVYQITLEPHLRASTEEFLNQTLRKPGASPTGALLGFGSLVEVDFGFEHAVTRHGHGLKTSKRYPDGLHDAEIYKRRLAVVIKVISYKLVLVAPITSQPVNNNSCVSVSTASLADLSPYGTSGKPATVLCHSLQPVSVRRILPPMSKIPRFSGWSRSTTYRHRLTNYDRKMLKDTLSRLYASDTLTELAKVTNAKAVSDNENMRLIAEVAQLKAELDTARALNGILGPLAHDWSKHLDSTLEDYFEGIENRDTLLEALALSTTCDA